MRRRLLWTLALLLAGSAPVSAQSPLVYRLTVSGVVENGLAPYIARGLREAAAAGASAVYLDIDTPGGRIDAAERIADAVGGSSVPVYAWVNPRAYSAGALIALSTRAIYMRPGAVLGAATPVDGSGVKASEKWFPPCAPSSGRWPRRTGSTPASPRRWWTSRSRFPASCGGRAPHVEHQRGASGGLRQGLRGKPARAAAGHRGPRRAGVSLAPNWAELVVRFLTNPLVSPLLLSLGILGLVLEIKTGSFGVGGLVSLASLGLFFGSSLLVGLAGWEEIILLGLGALALRSRSSCCRASARRACSGWWRWPPRSYSRWSAPRPPRGT